MTNITSWVHFAFLCNFVTAAFAMLIALAVKRTRPFIGGYLFIFSFIVGLDMWLLAAIRVYNLWGLPWLVLGLVLGGVGVVPMSVIALIVHKDFSSVLILFFQFAVLMVSRGIGSALVNKAS